MSRQLLGGWCAVVLLAVCGCAAPGATTTNAGGAHTGGLSLITEPGPSDRPFIALIDSARRSLRITMYELEDQRVERALAVAARRGVQVLVLLDHGYHGAGRPTNQAAQDYLRAHGVTMAWAPTYFALVHQKSIVIDRRTAAIMTLNLTPAYYSSSRDFAVLDRRPADVEAIARVFDADLRAQQITPGPDGGDLVWSPGAVAPISALIAHAQRSLEVESEEMDNPAMTRQLCHAAKRGVHVQILMTYQTAWHSALTYLAACRVQVHTYAASAALYIHAKLIRVDGTTVFIGSQNLSRQSLLHNRELGIITHNPQIAASTGHTFNSDFNAAQPYQP